MFSDAVTRRVVFFALLPFLIDGGAIVFAQVKSSTFYSTYDARELVKNRKYKGIDFAYGDMGSEISASELPKRESGDVKAAAQSRDGGGHSEQTKSVSYGCRIQTTGDDIFNVADFLDWLAKETINQIEGGKGVVVRQRHKVGKRVYIEYAQNGFTGRIEVDAEFIGKDQMNLDVEIIESSRK